MTGRLRHTSVLPMPKAGHVTKCEHCGSLYEVPRPNSLVSIEAEALKLLADDIEGAHEDCWRFFRAVWAPSPGYCAVRQLARDCAVDPSTLMSRFLRAGLPAPKRYLLCAQLTRAARLMEDPRVSFHSVAERLDYSTPQSFGRTIRQTTGLTAARFRVEYDGDRMLAEFREELVTPYRETLRAMLPLVGGALRRTA